MNRMDVHNQTGVTFEFFKMEIIVFGTGAPFLNSKQSLGAPFLNSKQYLWLLWRCPSVQR